MSTAPRKHFNMLLVHTPRVHKELCASVSEFSDSISVLIADRCKNVFVRIYIAHTEFTTHSLCS